MSHHNLLLPDSRNLVLPPRWTWATMPRSGIRSLPRTVRCTHTCCLHSEEWWSQLSVRTFGTRLTSWAPVIAWRDARKGDPWNAARIPA